MAPDQPSVSRVGNSQVMDGEKEEMVNEGMYGKAIALHLKEILSAAGYDVPFVCCEDWGWWVEIKGFPFVLGLCVYCWENEPGKVAEYAIMCNIEQERKWSWKKFRMISTIGIVGDLMGKVETAMRNDKAVQVIGRVDDFPM